MAVFYIAAGIYHFIRPQFYKKIIPAWLPNHLEIVYLTGGIEILLGFMLFFEPSRIIAACGIIILLIIVFPANIQMYQRFKQKQNPYTWIALLRLPLQPVLIWWAWIYTF